MRDEETKGTAPGTETRPEARRTLKPAEAAAIVVGGGPAGLFAALRLAEGLREAGTPGEVLLLERRERPARKLLLAGSGQCNLSHAGPVEDFLPRYGGGAKPGAAGRFLKPALHAFTNEELLDWFRDRGLEFETEAGGKVFPATRRASSVLDILLAECARLGVRLAAGFRVRSAERVADGFLLRAARAETAGPGDEEGFSAPLLLIATGGASYPKTGSSGDGYAFAAALGHRVVPPRPALTSVLIRGFTTTGLAGLAGLSFRNAELVLRRAGEKPILRSGDLLVTHEGFSGPLILDASRDMRPGDHLELGFSGCPIEEFRVRFDAELKAAPRALVRTSLAAAGLPKSLAERLVELAGLAAESGSAELRRESREALCRLACAFPAEIRSLGGFDEAMATAGGVDLAEVNPKTMESRVAPGLFFAGEVLDVDGDSGGYNLQAAFSTGALAARGMLEKALAARS
ncbi:MAG: NAD(P)/FAD-dependent oxidoreductase [Spirochaetaceae bacterium]|nr:NAD(P)/FAD-dependent oxidoreductase [Spirochaetaceae bacterium]